MLFQSFVDSYRYNSRLLGMKIALLYKANNLHLINRAKLFTSEGHKVYYFGFLPKERVSDENLSGLYRINIPEFPFFPDKLYKLNLLYRVLWIYQHAKEFSFDVLYIQGAGYGFLSILFPKKVVILEHMGSDVIILASKSYLRRFIYRLGYRNIDAVVQDSRLAQIKGIEYGAPEHNNFIINVGIDHSVFNNNIEKGVAKLRFGIEKDTKVIFSPRSINKLYNIDIIVAAIPLVIKEYADVRFVFSAHALDQEYFDLIMKNDYKDYIIIAGSLDNNVELPYMYADSDMVLSVPSSDSSPLTVYEAMACHIPVIVSDIDWYKDNFISGKHLLTVPVRDEIALSQRILDILNEKENLDLIDARRITFEYFDYKKENLKLITLMDNLIKKKEN